MTLSLSHERPLSLLTTLGLGGLAKHFVEVQDDDSLIEALQWAAREGEPVRVLGGGSNLVISDRGVDGLVLHMATRGIAFADDDTHVTVTAAAGEVFQTLVDACVDANLAGLECLTGIPGSVGATPIQNVGAYGQEVADTLEAIEVLDRRDLSRSFWPRAACGFGYRTSALKREPERYIVLRVRHRLLKNGAPCLRYSELSRALELSGHAQPSLRQVADAVWSLRASKSMVFDDRDPNHRSVGSFFTNPIVSVADAQRIQGLALSLGLIAEAADMPCFEAGEGKRKLAAGWLIERAGIQKGTRRGAVGVSTRHALQLVHHGGGSTAELLALADEIRRAVERVFGVSLEMEPVYWG